jgi:hypothetical protein
MTIRGGKENLGECGRGQGGQQLLLLQSLPRLVHLIHDKDEGESDNEIRGNDALTLMMVGRSALSSSSFSNLGRVLNKANIRSLAPASAQREANTPWRPAPWGWRCSRSQQWEWPQRESTAAKEEEVKTSQERHTQKQSMCVPEEWWRASGQQLVAQRWWWREWRQAGAKASMRSRKP